MLSQDSLRLQEQQRQGLSLFVYLIVVGYCSPYNLKESWNDNIYLKISLLF